MPYALIVVQDVVEPRNVGIILDSKLMVGGSPDGDKERHRVPGAEFMVPALIKEQFESLRWFCPYQ